MGESNFERNPNSQYSHEFLKRLNIEPGDTMVSNSGTRRLIHEIHYGELGKEGYFDCTKIDVHGRESQEELLFSRFLASEAALDHIEKADYEAEETQIQP